MAVIKITGAECNDATTEAVSISGGAVFSSSNPRTGSYAFRCETAGASAAKYVNATFSAGTDVGYYARAYVYFSHLPASTVKVMAFDSNQTVSAKLTSGGKLQLWDDIGGVQIGSDSATTITTGTWYRIELYAKSVTGANNDEAELRLDGSTVASATNLAFTAVPGDVLVGWVDAPGTTKICDVDDIVVHDTTGAANTSWPGAGGAVLLKPVSDNARASLWTGGAGGTTNLYDAVDNTPPVGTATETNTSQIEHAGNAAGTTDAYDANMTSYSTAGIQSYDTVNAVFLIAAHGEDASTGTKLLNFEVVSNPAIASTGNVTAGNDAGALGTYPTGWIIHRGTITQNPSVTVGTSPVMRARRPETATRVASVCAMFMYVAYTNGTPPVGGLKNTLMLLGVGPA